MRTNDPNQLASFAEPGRHYRGTLALALDDASAQGEQRARAASRRACDARSNNE